MDWQPIDTAPKDGTKILILDLDGETIEITEWCEPFPLYDYVQVEGSDLYRKVRTETDMTGFWNGNGHRARYWMPLPNPPTDNK